MYRNIEINGFRYLVAIINDRLYILGKTGQVGHCQNHGTMIGARV